MIMGGATGERPLRGQERLEVRRSIHVVVVGSYLKGNIPLQTHLRSSWEVQGNRI
jgi:hypothetical protein